MNSAVQQAPGSIELENSLDDEEHVRCSNCTYYYYPKYSDGRRCPRCGTPN